ncbi:toxin-antitoxin system YwqK family antitoxin [Rufibacter sediminis]|uniref:MORN repeat variant n=1 Tax=Rufibacter sediminis TaxID=2762756 RepID=A0ABR6VW29_9BACT|nr:hypothetical protein [Rufibacter sediminis]MBC3541390.1 hypothetical protein [Rufibacter sediminis]
MKIHLLSAFIFLFAFSSLAQTSKAKQPIILTTDTMFFDQDWEETELKEDIKYARIIKRTALGVPYGTVRDFYYPSWKKQWEGKLSREAPDVPTGLCTYWYSNGKVQSIATYKDGVAQEDMRMWHENGTQVVCKYKFVETLPLTRAKLLPYFDSGSSRTVQTISIPENSYGLVYKLDIRDEGQPPVTWATVATLASIPATLGTSQMLLAGASAMRQAQNSKAPVVSTKCHYFITTSKENAEYFLQTKGSILEKESIVWYASNTPQDTRHLAIPKGINTLYFCINNDNYQTSAEATLSVSVLQKQCK